MIRVKERVRVTPIRHELKRFFVDSQRTGQPPYLVDLDAYDCHGECSCADFSIRCRPHVVTELAKPRHKRELWWCVHLFWAHIYLQRELLWGMKDAEPKGPKAKFNREN